MRNGAGAYGWKAALNRVHYRPEGVEAPCSARVYHYTYRFHPPHTSSYERCISMSWCTVCREVAEGLVYVNRDTVLWDALADLPGHERERLSRSSRKLRDHLDGLVRRGLWPPEPPEPEAPARRRPRDRKQRRRRPPSPAEWD